MTDQRLTLDQNAIPPELDRWNWGAFLLNWIWGIGNNTFIALLTLVPVFGLIMPFVLGARGNRWAWRNGRWDSVEHFKRVQRAWARWACIVYLGAIAFFVLVIGGTFYILRHSEAYEMAASRLRASAEVASLVGTPITTGFPMGSIKTEGATGRAVLSFSVSGPKGAGRAFVEAVKKAGVWSLRSLTLKVDGRDGVINLMNQSKVEIDGDRSRAHWPAWDLRARSPDPGRLARW